MAQVALACWAQDNEPSLLLCMRCHGSRQELVDVIVSSSPFSAVLSGYARADSTRESPKIKGAWAVLARILYTDTQMHGDSTTPAVQ